MHLSRHGALPRVLVFAIGLVTAVAPASAAQNGPPSAPPAETASSARPALPADPTASTYLIGPDDVLLVVFWGDKDMSSEVTVRADGMISLPLLNDIKAAGLTPAALGAKLESAADAVVKDPSATVLVKQVNSRKVYISGMVEKSGAYPLTGPMTAVQLIATAGGFKDFAKTKSIVILRSTGAHDQAMKFNYNDVVAQKKDANDIVLQPGDRVIVP